MDNLSPFKWFDNDKMFMFILQHKKQYCHATFNTNFAKIRHWYIAMLLSVCSVATLSAPRSTVVLLWNKKVYSREMWKQHGFYTMLYKVNITTNTDNENFQAFG